MVKDYLAVTNVYKDLVKRRDELTQFKKMIQQRIKNYPEGRIHVIKNKNTIQYYLRTENTEEYISKKNVNKIKIYLNKRYDTKALKLIDEELSNIEILTNKSNDIVSELRNTYSNNPIEVKKLLNPIDISDEDYVNDWLDKSYQGKAISNDIPVYETDKGDFVRSKSELNIANFLYKMKIPYKYECPLVLNNGMTIYPDFTVLDIKERKEVYWEHRGMMDKEDYAIHAVKRVKDYNKNGIYLGDRLIITEETAVNPLGTNEIASVISHYFTKSTHMLN